jgi:hypothetical protein
MKRSKRLEEESAYVEQTLGETVICDRCGATLATYADTCTADLQDACPGFLRIEETREAFARSRIQA